MNGIKFSLSKQITLLVLVLLSVLQVLFDLFTTGGLFFIQICTGLAFLSFTFLEISEQGLKHQEEREHFFYFTHGMFAKKAIWIGALLICGFVLYFSQSAIRHLAPLVWVLIIGETLSLVWRFKMKAYYISIYANYIFLLQTSVRKIFAANVAMIEFRYDIFYLTLKDNQVEMLDLENLLPENREHFKQEFLKWADRNQLPLTDEAKEKLNLN